MYNEIDQERGKWVRNLVEQKTLFFFVFIAQTMCIVLYAYI